MWGWAGKYSLDHPAGWLLSHLWHKTRREMFSPWIIMFLKRANLAFDLKLPPTANSYTNYLEASVLEPQSPRHPWKKSTKGGYTLISVLPCHYWTSQSTHWAFSAKPKGKLSLIGSSRFQMSMWSKWGQSYRFLGLRWTDNVTYINIDVLPTITMSTYWSWHYISVLLFQAAISTIKITFPEC